MPLINRKIFTLSDIGKVVTGRTPSEHNPDHFGSIVPFITPSDMDGRRIINSPARRLSEKGKIALSRVLISKGVAVSCIGWQMGKSVLIDSLSVTNQQINSIIPNEEVVDMLYLYYELSSRREEIFRLGAGGSRTPILKKSDFEKLHILLPPLAEQRAIAAVLGALDDKIELNRRQNATLEALARAIFQSWFVDFDSVRAKTAGRAPAAMDAATAALFPDGFEEVAGREVPRGWRVTYLRDVARFVKGLSYKSSDLQESTTALVTLKSIGRGGGYRDEGLKPFVGAYKPEQVVRSGEIVVAHTDLTQAAEVLGRPALIRDHPHYDCLIASLDLMIVRPALEWMSKEFLYDLLSREEFKEHCYGYSNGTTVLHLSVKALPEYSFVLPSNQVIQAFTARSRPIYHKIEQNENQSRTLAALRDTLLPKLLSGEIRVREAGRLAEGVL